MAGSEGLQTMVSKSPSLERIPEFKKLLGATQHGDLLRLAFLFKESKIETINISVFIVFLVLEGLIIRE
jgi:hypothetical protein